MRVGLVIREQRPEYGGAYTFQSELLRAFCQVRSESRHEFVVLCPTEGAAEFARTQLDSAAQVVAYVKPPPSPLALMQSIAQRIRRVSPPLPVARRERIEHLARANGVEFIWNVSAGEVCIDVPHLAIVWDLEHRRVPWFPEVSANGLWEERERQYAHDLPRAAVVVTGTQVGKREIEQYYHVTPERIRVLPHPTPSLAERAASDTGDLPFDPAVRPFLFYPAQFWPHKNQAGLVRALAELRRLGVDLDLALTGSDKGNRPYVEALARELGLAERVHFLGFVDDAMLASLYRKALALAYVSFCGPENLPPLEAFSLGCPVVAADIAGAREQLAEAALFVDPADPGSIARAIRELQADPALRQRLVRKGALRAAAWTPRHFVRGVFRILDEFQPVRGAWGADT